jgi:hypothetical protein
LFVAEDFGDPVCGGGGVDEVGLVAEVGKEFSDGVVGARGYAGDVGVDFEDDVLGEFCGEEFFAAADDSFFEAFDVDLDHGYVLEIVLGVKLIQSEDLDGDGAAFGGEEGG